jgi:hypothetical protein
VDFKNLLAMKFSVCEKLGFNQNLGKGWVDYKKCALTRLQLGCALNTRCTRVVAYLVYEVEWRLWGGLCVRTKLVAFGCYDHETVLCSSVIAVSSGYVQLD